MRKQSNLAEASARDKTPQLIELSPLDADVELGGSILGGHLDAVHSIKTKLVVVAGETTLSIGELLGLKQAQVLKLDTLADAPVDILLEGKVVARGQLVAVDDNFGVQITEVPGVHAA